METNDSILKEIKNTALILIGLAREQTLMVSGCLLLDAGVTEPSIRILAFVMLFFIFCFFYTVAFGEKRTFKRFDDIKK